MLNWLPCMNAATLTHATLVTLQECCHNATLTHAEYKHQCCQVLWGRKRWFLTHRDEKPDYSPDETTLLWLRTRYYKAVQGDFRDKLYECTIGPGEALYFPDHWWHATLNIGDTVFMSTFT
eukprot:Tamp_28188.p1 GENE.Tamp_28188~~Tamp_28188.p1  ORF type:complete len:121 (+),score=5.67 Tamp_28188:324-686(+)